MKHQMRDVYDSFLMMNATMIQSSVHGSNDETTTLQRYHKLAQCRFYAGRAERYTSSSGIRARLCSVSLLQDGGRGAHFFCVQRYSAAFNRSLTTIQCAAIAEVLCHDGRFPSHTRKRCLDALQRDDF